MLHFTALMEVIVSSLTAILLASPVGGFRIKSCRARNLADWYTLLHNPTPNYEKKIYCTQEAVYPLYERTKEHQNNLLCDVFFRYTIVFMFYGLALSIMLLVRPWVCRKYLPRRSKMSIYAAMYFIPILTIIHALIGGLLCKFFITLKLILIFTFSDYAFPYLVVIISVISCAAHFAVRMDQKMTSLIKTTFSDSRNVVILVGHWCLHAYGIISITQLTNPTLHCLMILLVPLPALFYILTAKFTDPNKFQM